MFPDLFYLALYENDVIRYLEIIRLGPDGVYFSYEFLCYKIEGLPLLPAGSEGLFKTDGVALYAGYLLGYVAIFGVERHFLRQPLFVYLDAPGEFLYLF